MGVRTSTRLLGVVCRLWSPTRRPDVDGASGGSDEERSTLVVLGVCLTIGPVVVR